MSARKGALALCLAACVPWAAGSHAAENAPVGAWRTTSDCFMATFMLGDDGRAQAVYQTGERDDLAAWTWDGSTLRITSPSFPMDRFAAHMRLDRMEADYVWHDLDRDQLHRQTCVFERFTAPSI